MGEPLGEREDQLSLGYKGYALKKLKALALPIPEGFIVSTELFDILPAMTYEDLRRDTRERVMPAVRRLEQETGRELGNPDRPLRTLVITSPSPGEGKSTVAANLAVVMAQAGKRVILLDTDLRRPSLHHIFEVSNRQRGLTEALLSDNPTLDWYLKPTVVENLRLFTSGPLPTNPAELLGSPRMATLIEQLKEESDVVLFDSAPVLALTDASVLAAQSDGTLLVVEAGKTQPALAKEAAERLRRLGVHIVGVTLNRLQPGYRSYDYYYTSYEAYHVRDGRWKRAWTAIRRRGAVPLGRSKRKNDCEDAPEEKPIA